MDWLREKRRSEKTPLSVCTDLRVFELDSIAGAGVPGAKIDGETLDQYFLVRNVGREGLFLVARVTASAEDVTRALDLAGDMMATFEAPEAAAR